MREHWSDEDTAALRAAWKDGCTASQISNRFGGRYSRCAVLGKLNRLGLCGHGLPISVASRRSSAQLRAARDRKTLAAAARKRDGACRCRKAAGMPPVDGAADIVVIEAVAAHDVARVSFADLDSRHCRYVIGDPRRGHGYCGRDAVPGLSWCAIHAQRVYATPELARQIIAEKSKAKEKALEGAA